MRCKLTKICVIRLTSPPCKFLLSRRLCRDDEIERSSRCGLLFYLKATLMQISASDLITWMKVASYNSIWARRGRERGARRSWRFCTALLAVQIPCGSARESPCLSLCLPDALPFLLGAHGPVFFPFSLLAWGAGAVHV